MTQAVVLPPDLEAYVDARIAAGEYASAEEAVTAALNLLRERDDKLVRFRKLVEEGYKSLEEGPPCTVEEAIAAFDSMIAAGKKPAA
ncbi:MAG TPA: type II toxin-antitoxin system ParD family antitoxin [Caulobacteraceae bacterium]|jgi:putative addiction module CopG family antidote|nr:type II toxin-antitoxin system ParD family antitoxin [Caulobacteraceae bacterium]